MCRWGGRGSSHAGVWEKSLPGRGNISKAVFLASWEDRQQGSQCGWSGWRWGARVVGRRRQMPQGFVSSAKDTALMRWETTREYWVKEWNLFLHFKSIPLAAVRRTSCRESRVEAGRPVPEWFCYSSLHSLKHILRALQSRCIRRPYTQHRSTVFKSSLPPPPVIKTAHAHCRKLERNRKICTREKIYQYSTSQIPPLLIFWCVSLSSTWFHAARFIICTHVFHLISYLIQ